MIHSVPFGMFSSLERSSEYYEGSEWKGCRVKTSICRMERMKWRCCLSISGHCKVRLPIHQRAVIIRSRLNQSHFWDCWFNQKQNVSRGDQKEFSRSGEAFYRKLHQRKNIWMAVKQHKKDNEKWKQLCLGVELLWQIQAHFNTTITLGPVELSLQLGLLHQHIVDATKDFWHNSKLDYTHVKKALHNCVPRTSLYSHYVLRNTTRYEDTTAL